MVGVTSVNLGGIEVDVEDVADRLRRLKEREATPSSAVSTPGPENFSPFPETESPSPLVSRTTIARTSTPRTQSKPVESGDGDDKLKNFFQSLLVNKGK